MWYPETSRAAEVMGPVVEWASVAMKTAPTTGASTWSCRSRIHSLMRAQPFGLPSET